MSERSDITLEGLNTVIRAFKDIDGKVGAAALKGLEAGAMNIIADAKVNLRNNGSVVTGLLRESGTVERIGEDIYAGFFDTQNTKTGYAEYVEYGRRAGKMPPVAHFRAWVYKKFHLRDWKEAESIAWAIAKKIAREGTKPHPFFTPAITKNQTTIINTVRDAIRKATK